MRSGTTRTRTVLQRTAIAVIAASIGGCAALPTNGPTGAAVLRDETEHNDIGFKIVTIDATNIGAMDVGVPSSGTLASLAADAPVDLLGPGDVLAVQIYEVGASLFASGRSSAIGGSGSTDSASAPPPTAGEESLGDGVVVDRNGQITVPYAGQISVAGLTTREVQDRILAALRGKSQSPQVIVSRRRNVTSTVLLMGAVTRPGRYPLSLAREHLLDLVALAGGISLNANTGGSTATGTGPQDMVIRFTRAGRTVEEPLDEVRSGSADDLLLVPGDRVELIRQPRTFTVFGAIDRISQVPFESRVLSLAEALARAGGPSDARADPRSIFVFRLQPAAASAAAGASPGTPMVYRIDMLRAQNYLLAQRFAMRDKDVIYIANARANQPAKLAQIFGQLFSPFVAARTISQ